MSLTEQRNMGQASRDLHRLASENELHPLSALPNEQCTPECGDVAASGMML